eukprot:TRINITY_DN15955_c0_g1_i1.p1 TRINITY_DN15955_c0_g1~~TRINITY_DN15955_c0_g1_i1.p1  ORF type:complete len:165 (-),score=23.48 TRINITY_DN15955_c0_g1_i1:59-553(-)
MSSAPTKPTQNVKLTKLADLRPYMKGINCIFIVLEKGAVTKTKENHTISHCLIADNTASIHLSLWDSQGDSLQPGDIIRLSGGYCTLFKNSLILYSGRYGNLERTGEFQMVFTEVPNMSTLVWKADSEDPKKLVPLAQSHQGNAPPQALLNQYSSKNPMPKVQQ